MCENQNPKLNQTKWIVRKTLGRRWDLESMSEGKLEEKRTDLWRFLHRNLRLNKLIEDEKKSVVNVMMLGEYEP